MEIKWLGGSSFLIKNSIGKRVLIDPFLHNYSDDLSSIIPNIITLSHNHFNDSLLDNFRDKCPIINTPTNFSNEFCTIQGFSTYHDNVNGLKRGENIIYKYNIDNYALCHLGHLGHLLCDDLIAELGVIDILFIPIGGHLSLNGETASKLVKSLSPRYVIPMSYRTVMGPQFLDGPQKFIKLLNYTTHVKDNPFNFDIECTINKLTELIIFR
ncbi:MAG: MBL fold metallo-hydrolase [Clostridium sp.]